MAKRRKAVSIKPKIYHVQWGETRHPLYISRYTTEGDAKKAAHAQVDYLFEKAQVLCADAIPALTETKADIDAICDWSARPQIVHRVIEPFGMTLHFEFWKDPT